VNSLKSHKARKVAVVDGVAISAGSIIAMAADEIRMHAGSLMMIHAPWGGAKGNATELRKTADVMDKWAEAMVQIYVAKTGKPEEEIRGMFQSGEDYWYTAEEAKAAGFADTIIGETKTAKADGKQSKMRSVAQALYAMASFNHGERMSDTPQLPNAEGAPEAEPQKDAVLPAPNEAPEASPVVEASINPADMIAKAVAEAVAAATAKSEELIAQAKAEATAAQAKLAEELDAKELREVQAFVKASYAFLPGVNDDTGVAIRAMRRSAPEAAAKIECVLAAANALMQNAQAVQMAPKGVVVNDDNMDPEAKISKLAKELLASGSVKTIEQARAMVYNQNPELVEALRGNA
jgi:hypothetical protein